MSDVTPDKRSRRAAARAHRGLVEAADRAGSADAWAAQLLTLPEVAAARTVAAYVSYGTEPPTDALIAVLRGRGVRILLPVLLADKDLDWTDGDSPVGVDAIAEADVVVVPALLVDASGTRLGQGGGSYDRALARARTDTAFVALVHDDEILEAGALPREPHDVAVTHAVTPTRVVALAGPAR
jgi:5-formyltetrahydrofolate cyclo-ligase